MSEVRINGLSIERIQQGNRLYAQWSVEVLRNDGAWEIITTCYGPAALSSAVLIARAWEANTIPSPIDAVPYTEWSHEEAETTQ